MSSAAETRCGALFLSKKRTPNHMQIMQGDLVETIRTNSQCFHHYHTGGVPGSHEIGASQEVNYPAVMHAILESGFKGIVAHEYVPSVAPELSLKQAFEICNI